MPAHILSILELKRQFGAEAPKRLKVMERLRRQLLARQLYTGSLVGKHGRMFVYYNTPRSPAMPDAIEILKDGTMKRVEAEQRQ